MSDDKTKCQSCGVSWVDHLGIAPTCAQLSRYRIALENIRDAVLHERYQLSGDGLDSRQINAVLAIIDDNYPSEPIPEPTK